MYTTMPIQASGRPSVFKRSATLKVKHTRRPATEVVILEVKHTMGELSNLLKEGEHSESDHVLP